MRLMRFNLEMRIKYSNTHAMKACAECESCSETSDNQVRGLTNRPVYFMPRRPLWETSDGQVCWWVALPTVWKATDGCTWESVGATQQKIHSRHLAKMNRKRSRTWKEKSWVEGIAGLRVECGLLLSISLTLTCCRYTRTPKVRKGSK